MVNFPAQIDILPIVAANAPLALVQGSILNILSNAITAIETTLGVNPAATYGTVAGRLTTLDTLYGNIKINLGHDLSGSLNIDGTLNSVAPSTVIGIQGRPVSPVTPAIGNVLTWDGIAWIPALIPSGGSYFLNGDVNGTQSATVVVGIQGHPISTTAPTSGQVLEYIGGLWTPANVSGSPTGGAGGDLSGNYPNPTVAKLQGFAVNSVTPNNGFVLTWDNTDGYWKPEAISADSVTLGGDVTGAASSNTVVALQGNAVANTAPTTTYVLTWNGSSWGPAPTGGLSAVTIFPSRITMVAGAQAASGVTNTVIGGTSIDMSDFPVTSASGQTRSVYFGADYLAASGSDTAQIQLWDATNGAVITGTTNTTSNTTVTRFISSALTVGTSNGNVRTDSAAQYQVQLAVTAGSLTDDAVCYNAYIIIKYV
ncbi:MAG TPA: hypothetical protein VII94_03770 [Candidatus Saccharimonadales bacterium]